MEKEICGIILDAQERGAGSRSIKLFSKQGALFFLVPRFKGSFCDLTQPLHRVRYWLEEGLRGFVKFREGVVEERFPYLRADFPRMEAAQTMRWVALKMIRPGLACEEFYQTFYAHLRALNDPFVEALSASALLSSFLVKTLLHEGVLDFVSPPACHLCGKRTYFMGLSLTNSWACQRHSREKTALFDPFLQERLLWLGSNRSLRALKEFREPSLTSHLLTLIKNI